MLLSVVVCTRNRLESLKRCLRSFEAIKTDEDWELIIVDNGSSDGTAEFLKTLPPFIAGARMVTTSEPSKGLGRARNKGVEASRGDVISFTDDDCYVAEDYVTEMVGAFRGNPGIGFLGGRVLLYDKADLPLTIKESDRPAYFQPRTFLDIGSLLGANMAFRRDVLTRVGGFEELFGAGSYFCAEDIAAAADALWAGFAGAYDPRPTVLHHHGRRARADFLALSKEYDIGRGAYFARYILRPDSRRVYLNAYCGRLVAKITGPVRMLARRLTHANALGSENRKLPELSRPAWLQPIILFREITSGLRYAWLSGSPGPSSRFYSWESMSK